MRKSLAVILLFCMLAASISGCVQNSQAADPENAIMETIEAYYSLMYDSYLNLRIEKLDEVLDMSKVQNINKVNALQYVIDTCKYRLEQTGLKDDRERSSYSLDYEFEEIDEKEATVMVTIAGEEGAIYPAFICKGQNVFYVELQDGKWKIVSHEYAAMTMFETSKEELVTFDFESRKGSLDEMYGVDDNVEHGGKASDSDPVTSSDPNYSKETEKPAQIILPDEIAFGDGNYTAESITAFEYEAEVDFPWSYYGGFPQADVFYLDHGNRYESAVFSAYGEQVTDFKYERKTVTVVVEGWFMLEDATEISPPLYYSIDGILSNDPPKKISLRSVGHNASNFGEMKLEDGYHTIPGNDIGLLGMAAADGTVVRDPGGMLYFPHYTDDEGIILYRDTQGLWSFINRRGETVFPEKYEKADGFFNGFAIVNKGGKICLLDRSGEILIETVFSDCLSYNPYSMVFLMEYIAESGDSACGLVKIALPE